MRFRAFERDEEAYVFDEEFRRLFRLEPDVQHWDMPPIFGLVESDPHLLLEEIADTGPKEQAIEIAKAEGRLEEYRSVHGNSLLGGPCHSYNCTGCEHTKELERRLGKLKGKSS